MEKGKGNVPITHSSGAFQRGKYANSLTVARLHNSNIDTVDGSSRIWKILLSVSGLTSNILDSKY